jgi:hypothetical protein
MAGRTSNRLLHSDKREIWAVRFVPFVVSVIATTASMALSAEKPPTYCRDIAPVINNNCVTCHRPGEVAPFSLRTYKDVRRHGRLIAAIVQAKIMPPWKPAPGYGEFVGARRLTDEQVALIQKWVKAGMPEGNQEDLREPPTFASGWQLGTPDIVLTMPEPYQVPADGNDVLRNFVLPLEIPDGKYIRAVEYRPGNRRVVHHAALCMDRTGSARKLDEADPGPGFTQSSLPPLLPGNLGIWTPGWKAVPLPDGFALPWPKGTDLILQLHLSPSGKPEREQSTVGIYLTDQPPSNFMVDILLEDLRIDIPPGEKAYRTHDSMTLPVEVDVFGVFPHMHRLGKEAKVTARLPDGSEKVLLWINDWNFNWQMYYQNVKPVRLPANTELATECVHDNSAENPNNPSVIPQRVQWGEQTRNEMSCVVIQVIPTNKADGSMLWTMESEREIEKGKEREKKREAIAANQHQG